MKRRPYSLHILKVKRRKLLFVDEHGPRSVEEHARIWANFAAKRRTLLKYRAPKSWTLMKEARKRGIPVIDQPLVHSDIRDYLALPWPKLDSPP
jgi:hypothetical protein